MAGNYIENVLILPMVIIVTKMSYITWIFLHTNLNRRFALVNSYFLGSKMNSLRVLVKNFRTDVIPYIIGSKLFFNETRKLFI